MSSGGGIRASSGGLDRVHTERLVGERLRAEHLAELAPLLCHARVWPTLWAQPTAPSCDDIRAQLAQMIVHWQRHGFGLWLLRDRLTGETIGRGGLEYTRASGRQEVEVAWVIDPARWRQGLATELARCAVDRATCALGLAEVIALTLPTNVASRRVMEKAGFRFERNIVHAGLPHVLYRRALGSGSVGD